MSIVIVKQLLACIFENEKNKQAKTMLVNEFHIGRESLIENIASYLVYFARLFGLLQHYQRAVRDEKRL